MRRSGKRARACWRGLAKRRSLLTAALERARSLAAACRLGEVAQQHLLGRREEAGAAPPPRGRSPTTPPAAVAIAPPVLASRWPPTCRCGAAGALGIGRRRAARHIAMHARLRIFGPWRSTNAVPGTSRYSPPLARSRRLCFLSVVGYSYSYATKTAWSAPGRAGCPRTPQRRYSCCGQVAGSSSRAPQPPPRRAPAAATGTAPSGTQYAQGSLAG